MLARALIFAILATPLFAQPKLALKPAEISVNVNAGAAGDQNQKVNFILENTGSLTNFVVRTDQPWIAIDTENGFVDFNGEVALSVTIFPSGFEAGQYTALVTIQGEEASVTLTITLNVIGIRIAVNPASVSFALVAGSSSSAPVVASALNGAIGQVIVQKDAGGGWLTWNTTPGTGELPNTVSVLANTEGLAVGTYTGKLRVSCFNPTLCVPKVIDVSLQVFALSQLGINPSTVIFATNTNTPATQTSPVNLVNTGADTSFTSTITNLPGVTISPSSGTIRQNQPIEITITANPNGVAPGNYSGTVQFAGTGSSTTLNVRFQITGIGVTPSTLALSAIKGKQAVATFTVTGTEPFTIQRQTGGPWLNFSPTFAVAPQTVTVTADSTTLPEGLTLGSLTINCGADCLARTVIVQFTVTALRVVSSADYKSGLARGSIVAAFAPGITTVTQSATLPLPTTIANVSVLVVDSASKQFQARMFFASPGQVNFEVPQEAALGPATVTIQNPSGAFASGTFTITAIAPSLYTQDGSGTGPPAAYIRYFAANSTETQVLAASCDAANKCTPVAIDVRRSPTLFLELYGTGIRNRTSLANVTANIGGTILSVVFAGAQPQFPGLDQVDFQLPTSLAGRGATTVILVVDGIATQPVNVLFQ